MRQLFGELSNLHDISVLENMAFYSRRLTWLSCSSIRLEKRGSKLVVSDVTDDLAAAAEVGPTLVWLDRLVPFELIDALVPSRDVLSVATDDVEVEPGMAGSAVGRGGSETDGGGISGGLFAVMLVCEKRSIELE